MIGPLHQRKGVAHRALFHLDIVSGVFAVDFPDLPGCVGRGSDFVQARDHAKHALDAWIDASLGRGEAVPVPGSRQQPQPVAHMVWIAARSGFEQQRLQPVRGTT